MTQTQMLLSFYLRPELHPDHKPCHKGPSIYDVRTEAGGGVRELADFADEQY